MKKITQSKEDYLRVLLELSEHSDSIHSMDLACALGLSKASISRMMNVLKDAGYVMKEKYGTITLTESGRNIAVSTMKKRNLLKHYLINVLGVTPEIAELDSCRMEHVISKETEEKLAKHLNDEKYLNVNKK
ncbi:metal-dependent transcriptional regulator [Anaerovorax odorimutans]|uniref:metal-dependent transcriptional regulator n=1 Tax=Anaerovorax odorimutans TaxID=109327 RepID=UPI000409B4A6|nr:metal-dependent transcriptional regulator [Anaerovorax odorimutans]